MINDRRYELKFRIQQRYIGNFFDWIDRSPALFCNLYIQRKVSSIYFDTNLSHSLGECYNDSLEKVKVRLRWYDDDMRSARLEVKSKFGLISMKKIDDQFNSEFKDIVDLMQYCACRYFKDDFLSLYLLNPKVIVSYQREYYESSNPVYPNLRVTIDTDVEFQRVDHSGLMGIAVPEGDDVIMEVKFPVSIYNDAVYLLRNLNAELTKNSKFVNAFEFV